MIYYVSPKGDDRNAGTKEAPFFSINHAAQIAMAGDTVRVFGGTYRNGLIRGTAVRKTPASFTRRWRAKSP